MNVKIVAGLTIVMGSAFLFAAPQVKVDEAEFDVGSIIEGSKEKVRHEFVLTNTGDEALRIKDVRAG